MENERFYGTGRSATGLEWSALTTAEHGRITLALEYGPYGSKTNLALPLTPERARVLRRILAVALREMGEPIDEPETG